MLAYNINDMQFVKKQKKKERKKKKRQQQQASSDVFKGTLKAEKVLVLTQ